MKNLIDEEGENDAVRTFLALYGGVNGSDISVARMREHLEESGFENCTPPWIMTGDRSLTKSGAQAWLRFLFALEQPTEVLSENGVNSAINAFLLWSDEYHQQNKMLTISRMKEHLIEEGFQSHWPFFIDDNVVMSKSITQTWLRYLFSLESSKNTWDDSAKNEKVDEVPPNWPYAVPVVYRNSGEGSFGPVTMASIESLNKGSLPTPLPTEYSMGN